MKCDMKAELPLELYLPLGCEERKARCDSRFKYPQKKANGYSASKVGASSHTTQRQSPHYYIKRRPLRQRKSLKQAIGRIFPDKISNIKHRSKPLIISTVQMDVSLHAHDAGIREGRLVEVIEAVDNTEHLRFGH